MSYLLLNGYAIPIDSCEPAHMPIAASDGHSQNGIYQLTRNGFARVWKCRSGLLDGDTRATLAEMLGHYGDAFGWDLTGSANGVSTTAADFYSNKFRAPTANVATVVSAYGADGSRVYDWKDTAVAPFDDSSGAVSVDPASTNLLASTEASPTASGDLADFGAPTAKTFDTARRWTGNGSIKVVADSGNGVQTGTFDPGGSDCVISAHLSGDGAGTAQIRLRLWDETAGATRGNADLTMGASAYGDKWRRIVAFSNACVGGNLHRLRVESLFTPSTFYVDGLAAEALDTYPSAWQAGGASRTGGILTFDRFNDWTNGFTAICWVNYAKTGVASTQSIFDLADGNPRALAYIDASGVLNWQVIHSANGALLIQDSGITAGAWSCLAFTYDPDLNQSELWRNGVSQGTDSTWGGRKSRWDIERAAGSFDIGSQGTAGTLTSPGTFGPMFFLPYRASDSFIEGVYQSGVTARMPPKLYPLTVEGDLLRNGHKSVRVIGKLDSMPHEPYFPSGSFDAHSGRVAFTLIEAQRR